MNRYGPRDSVSIVTGKGHKLSYRWPGAGSRYWVMDGKRVSLAQIEDLADRYEPGCYRYTERARPLRTRSWLRTFTGRDVLKVLYRDHRAVVTSEGGCRGAVLILSLACTT